MPPRSDRHRGRAEGERRGDSGPVYHLRAPRLQPLELAAGPEPLKGRSLHLKTHLYWGPGVSTCCSRGMNLPVKWSRPVRPPLGLAARSWPAEAPWSSQEAWPGAGAPRGPQCWGAGAGTDAGSGGSAPAQRSSRPAPRDSPGLALSRGHCRPRSSLAVGGLGVPKRRARKTPWKRPHSRGDNKVRGVGVRVRVTHPLGARHMHRGPRTWKPRPRFDSLGLLSEPPPPPLPGCPPSPQGSRGWHAEQGWRGLGSGAL
uniref:Uncharacterized protein n=1 Tax=Myotis myotis TaxID=51298 RepID=A0A7J7ZYS3_MYOMY|nr:hypothetical protein mMyoMyo1_010019 [Myotis myotis]